MDLYKAALLLGAVICTGSEPSTIAPKLNCITSRGQDYRGTISVTKSGKTCQSWSSQTPHPHQYTSDKYPLENLEENYCRNPGNLKSVPWCYTTDPDTRWEFCSVPSCGNSTEPEECLHCNGEDYRGTISTTMNGYTCQRWDSMEPHKHSYTSERWPDGDLVENYCRNPGSEMLPWCYTTSSSLQWDYCSIPRCTSEPPTIIPELNCITGKGKAYRGTISVTESGKTCQRWSSKMPHSHKYTPDNYPCAGLEENYCRNPDNSAIVPWCYTTDDKQRWDYCRVPACRTQSKTEECMPYNSDDYRGTNSTTENGFTCQYWNLQTPHKHDYIPKDHLDKHLEENYCRNPNGDVRPWCFTTNPLKRRDYCSIPQCTSEPPTSTAIIPELTCLTGEGQGYRGTMAVTRSGITCQSWSSMMPHKHNHTTEDYPWGALESNYCRNPDDRRLPWCYTTDPGIRWQYCNVMSCATASHTEECIHCNGENYGGKISITENSHTCQRWDSQTPHQHYYNPNNKPSKHLEENYCRNPDGDVRPWCFTTSPNHRKEYCSIPTCTSKPPSIVPEVECFTGRGKAYRGRIAVTKSGKTCKTWSSFKKQKTQHVTNNFVCAGLESNYCRSPDGLVKPWCYYTDTSTEYCDVPSCANASRSDVGDDDYFYDEY